MAGWSDTRKGMEVIDLALVAVSLALGGILKGAIGAGAPVLAVPMIALLVDVPTAVAVFTLPNLISNIWQARAYRRDLLPMGFVCRFAISGMAGAAVGSVILAVVTGEVLMATLAAIVFGYIALRLSRPGWSLSRSVADRVVLPVGLVAGVMQGAGGISAPVSLTFLDSMRLERGAFISTVSVFFAAMGLV